MNARQKLVVFGLATVLPVAVLLPTNATLLIFVFAPLPIFSGWVVCATVMKKPPFLFLNAMNAKQKLVVFGLATVLSVTVVLPTSAVLLIFAFASLPIFSGWVVCMTVMKKSNGLTFATAAGLSTSYPILLHMHAYLTGSGFH